MSLAIDIDRIQFVLLADGWHECAWMQKESSFSIDAYEYVQRRGAGKDPYMLLGGAEERLIPSRGFSFIDAEDHLQLCGPLTAILAIKIKG